MSNDRGAIKTSQVYKALPQSTLVISEITGSSGATDPVTWYVLKMTEEEFKRLLESAPFVSRAVIAGQ